MGLSFGTLVNAALGGSAAYMGGKRDARARAAKAAQDEEYNLSRIQENAAQAASARAAAALAQDKLDHPEKHMAAKTPPRQQQWEAEQEFYSNLVKGGAKPGDARKATDIRFGHNAPPEHGPTPGTAEYYKMIDKTEGIRDRHQKSATGRDTGEAGSAKAATDRREFMQNRITHYTDAGFTGAEAQANAEREYLGAQYSANHAAGMVTPQSTTAKALARTIPGSSSSNAGTRGVKPTETSSTQKANPNNANSPKVGTMRQATDADIDRAIAAVGEDEAKIEKWLHDHRLEP